MSWLARSIANTLRLDDDDEDEEEFKHNYQNDVITRAANSSSTASSHAVDEEDSSTYEEIDLEDRSNNYNNDHNSDDDDDTHNRGVKEDLSEFTETLTRQLWGVASFLAPPPPPPLPPRNSDLFDSDRNRIEESGSVVGSEDEEAEYVGEGAGYFENSGDEVEESEGDAVGVTEEVLAFATNIAHHPETWLDFPLADEEEFDGLYIVLSNYIGVLEFC
nr:uncharacterized protein LOC104093745 [Nicotiana tomentosiformis]